MTTFRSLLFSFSSLFAIVIGPHASASTHTDSGQKGSVLSDILDNAYDADAPGACAIVIKDGKVLFRAARGLADMELGAALQPDSVLRIGSITKQFTAAAILLLVQDGKLSLSDPITKFLPEFPVQGRKITLEHLLSHTSGIRNYTEIPAWASTTRTDLSVEQLLNVFKDEPLEFEPGERWKYSNSGYVLLGSIIERVSGSTYADFIRSRILDPLQMRRTRVDDPTAIIVGRAAGYAREGQEWRNSDYLSMSHPYAAGALMSSVEDLARWHAAIENNELLRKEFWTRASTSFELPDGTQTRYGAGWILGRVGALDTLEHGGGINGFNAYVLRVPAERLFVAVLANAAPPRTPPQEVALRLATTVLETSLYTAEITLAPKMLDQYVGTYEAPGTTSRRVFRMANRLYASHGDAKLQLTPVGVDLFEARADHSRFRFIRHQHRITAVSVEPRILMGEPPAKRVGR